MPAVKSAIGDVCCWNFVQCECPSKKSTSQLYTSSGSFRQSSLSSRVECRTVSNALLKSKEITATYRLVVRRNEIV